MVKKILWQELRRTEFEQAVKGDAIVIIPVASMEQHGDHLPVNTDANACFTIAQRAAQAIDEFPVLVLPVIWTGLSANHMAYPGTITLTHRTFTELLTEVAVSVYAQGFKKIFFLNGHGGNDWVIASMRSKLATEEHVSSVIGYTWWHIPSVARELDVVSGSDISSVPHAGIMGRPGEPERSIIGHAGERETSIQLYIQPELVDMDAAVWAQGVLGDPSAATHEKGERLVNAAIDAIVRILRDYHSGKLEVGLYRGTAVFQGSKVERV